MTAPPVGRGKLRRWWRMATLGVDHEDVLRQIRDDSGWTGRYAFLIAVSAAIALLGLLLSSAAVVIGAMLLSPLMMPIIGLGFGIATLDFREIRRAGSALVVGSVLAVALTALIVAASPVQTITAEIAARTQPTLFDLLVALLSALAGSYALIRGRGGTVVGVAIATALMPPLAVVGFGVATLNITVFWGALLLFLTNAVTIALTAALVARIYGFGSHLSPHHTGWQLLLFVVALGLLSVPLGAGLQRIAFAAVVQRQTRSTLEAFFPSGSRLSQVDIDRTSSPLRVRAVMLTPRVVADADRALAARLRALLDQPVDIHVDQVRISPETAAVEAAQIARASDASGREGSGDARAAEDLALIAGVAREAVRVDGNARSAAVEAAPLPGLLAAGYRALEARAATALPGWTVRLAPPPNAPLPDVAVTAGIIDDAALSAIAWASARRGEPVTVAGGLAAQRRAVVVALVARGGQASVGPARGPLRAEWQQPDGAAGDAASATAARPQR